MKSLYAALIALTPLVAHAFELVSPQEYAQELAMGDAKPRGMLAAQDRDGPSIRVVRPKDNAVKSPFDINVEFTPKTGAAIDLKSIKILYGTFALDVTARVLAKATISPQGIAASNAEVPAGKHSFKIVVADTQGRTGVANIRVEVL